MGWVGDGVVCVCVCVCVCVYVCEGRGASKCEVTVMNLQVTWSFVLVDQLL